MKLECILHGTPKGHNVSNVKYTQVMSQFYTQSHSVKQQFLCQVLQNGVYYHLILTPTFDIDNREGGYFGLSIYMDKVYTNLDYLYNLMQIAFNKYVKGRFLQPQGVGYRYKIFDFQERANDLKELSSFFLTSLQMVAIAEHFEDIARFSQHSKAIRLTWGDYRSDEEIIALLKRSGSLSFSNEYESDAIRIMRDKLSKEKLDCEEKVRQMQSKYSQELQVVKRAQQGEIQNMKNEINEYKRDLQRVKEEKQQLVAQLSQAEKELKRVKADLEAAKSKSDPTPKLEQLRTLLLDLSASLPKPVVKTPNEQQEDSIVLKIKDFLKEHLAIILIICLLLLQTGQLFIVAKQGKDNQNVVREEVEVPTYTIEQEEQVNDSTIVEEESNIQIIEEE